MKATRLEIAAAVAAEIDGGALAEAAEIYEWRQKWSGISADRSYRTIRYIASECSVNPLELRRVIHGRRALGIKCVTPP